MDFPEKDEIFTKEVEKNINNVNDIDKFDVFYYFKCCSCLFIFFTFWFILFLWFPVLLILLYTIQPYKKVVYINKIQGILIFYDTGIIPCCKLKAKQYFLASIKKVIIYITSKPDPKIGFQKLYFSNCDMISTEGERESLFNNISYDENRINDFIIFLRKYIEVEFQPIDNNKDGNLIDLNNINTNSGENNNIATKLSLNEDPALPAYA